jgi:hypothetical protein
LWNAILKVGILDTQRVELGDVVTTDLVRSDEELNLAKKTISASESLRHRHQMGSSPSSGR